MGSPADYPNFANLVKHVAQGHQLQFNEKVDTPDRFLGRLKHSGVEVHKIVQKMLSKKESKPTKLHEAIINLFPSLEEIKIVTTNFDNHFTTVINKNSKTEEAGHHIYYAPALPIGSEFTGLVYLHGSVISLPSKLVLTDEDFGRAYITQGWARNFVIELFDSHHVLFVGYSHKDILMSYLTRGLISNNNKLYALDKPDVTKQSDKNSKSEDWDYLGVKYIEYPSDKNNGHEELTIGIEEWSKYISMGIFDHKHRISELLNGLQTILKTDDDDYLLRCCSKTVTLKIFVKYAKNKRWLLWANERGLLKPLFSKSIDQNQDNDVLQIFSQWLSEAAINYTDTFLDIFRKENHSLSERLCLDIALYIEMAENVCWKKITPLILIIIQEYPKGYTTEFLVCLLERTLEHKQYSIALVLIDFLIQPQNITPAFDRQCLSNALDKIKPFSSSELAEKLALLSIYKIQLAYQCDSQNEKDFDLLSFERSAIEPHTQNCHQKEAFNISINFARDSLEYLLKHKRKAVNRFRGQLIESEFAILCRIAIHLMTEDKLTKADTKIKWICEYDLLKNIYHHEVYRLMKNAYPKASKERRQQLLDYAEDVKNRKILSTQEKQDDKTDWHNFFRVCRWLDSAVDGTCPIVKKHLKEISSKYPNFGVSDYPDFLHYHSTIYSTSPKQAEELLSMPISDARDFLITYEKKNYKILETRERLLSEVQKAVTQQPDWGIKIAKELDKKDNDKHDILPHIFGGWGCARLSSQQWEAILSLIGKTKKHLQYTREVASLIESGMKPDAVFRSVDSLAKDAEKIAIEIIKGITSSATTVPETTDTSDWYTCTINRPANTLTLFFINLIADLRNKSGDTWNGIPEKYKQLFSEVIENSSYEAQMSRIILASHLHLFYYWDPKWTEENIIVLFDWEQDSLRAQQAWHGYLSQGKVNDEYLDKLSPLYIQSFERIEGCLDKKKSERLLVHVVQICCFSSKKTIAQELTIQLLSRLSEENLYLFANEIFNTLSSGEDGVADQIWEGWLSKYLKQRQVGKPVPFNTKELAYTFKWAIHLNASFPEAVALIEECLNGVGNVKIDSFFLYNFAQNMQPEKYPEATAIYIRSYLHYPKNFWHIDKITAILQIIEADADPTVINEIRELVAQYKPE